MKKQLLVILFAIACVSSGAILNADTIMHFGDFEDGFGTVGVTYDSAVTYDPGVVASVFHEGVVGIPKFDPSLGTLTDITVFVDGIDPILYSLAGGMIVTEVDDTVPTGYGATISLEAAVFLSYGEGVVAMPLFGDAFSLFGGGIDAPGTGSFGTPVLPVGADGTVTGFASIFGLVDLADFVGVGSVDELYVDMLVESTADFTLDNATATATLGFDVFDSDSGADDPVIGIIYTFSVPEPSSALLLVSLMFSFAGKRRRR